MIFEYAQQIGLINEGKINQITMGLKIKPHLNIEQIFKSHKYPGLLNLVEETNSLDDLLYLRSDYHTGLRQFETIKTRIDMCEKLGDCDKTKNFYKGIKKKYLDKGITVKDVDSTIKWYQEVYYPKLSEKIKNIRSQNK